MTRTVVHYVDSDQFGGAEQAMLHLMSELRTIGWRPVLVCHESSGLSPLVDRVRELGLEHHFTPTLHGLRASRGALPFVQLLSKLKPDVFHAHLNWPLACSGGLMLAAARRVYAKVATVQLYGELPGGLTVRALRSIVPRLVDQYVAVSSGVERRLHAELGVDPRRTTVVKNGIDCIGIRPDADSSVRRVRSQDRPAVLCVARLERQKGLTFLMEAAARLPQVEFMVAGDGPDRESLRSRASELGISHRFHLLGFRTDVPALLEEASVFVLPSLYEGLPLAALEAMASGRPVVATSIEGTDEIIEHGRSGLLVPPADPAALASAIEAMLSDGKRAQNMAEAGRIRVNELFSARSTACRVARVYEKLLNKPKSSSNAESNMSAINDRHD